MFRHAAIVCALLPAMLAPLCAQQTISVGNQYVTASVVADPASPYGGGRFYIDAGPAHSGFRFLYYITSFVVFRVATPSGVQYVTNARTVFGSTPSVDGTEIPYLAFDHITTLGSTTTVTWNNVHGYLIRMRLVAETPSSPYQRGSDVLIEFEYSRIPGSSATSLGILMMLDTYNGQASGTGGTGDKASVLTNRGYFATTDTGRLFNGPAEIPDFYHVGNFLYQSPLNTVLPIHRLHGTSHDGALLTEPSLFAVGNWRAFRSIGWDVPPSAVGLAVGDCATITRWDSLGNSGTVRTAFGMDDRDGNDVFHCRDNEVFVDIQTVRVVRRDTAGAPITPNEFNVATWVTNTTDDERDYTVTFVPPSGSPGVAGVFVVTGPAPLAQTVTVAPHATAHVNWHVQVTRVGSGSVDIPLDIRYSAGSPGGVPRVLRVPCTPTITVIGPPVPKADVVAPTNVITRDAGATPRWSVKMRDRHANFLYDTGIDTITVDPLRTVNMRFTLMQPSVRCDTSSEAIGTVDVVDTTKAAIVVFAVRDCAGNTATDSIVYTPQVSGVAHEAGSSDALAVVAVMPQPIHVGRTEHVDIVLRNVSPGGAVAYLIAADGRIVAEQTIAYVGNSESRHALVLPVALPSGWYVLRMRSGGETAQTKIVLVR